MFTLLSNVKGHKEARHRENSEVNSNLLFSSRNDGTFREWIRVVASGPSSMPKRLLWLLKMSRHTSAHSDVMESEYEKLISLLVDPHCTAMRDTIGKLESVAVVPGPQRTFPSGVFDCSDVTLQNAADEITSSVSYATRGTELSLSQGSMPLAAHTYRFRPPPKNGTLTVAFFKPYERVFSSATTRPSSPHRIGVRSPR